MAIGYKKEYILQIVLQNPGEVQAEFWVSVCIMHAKSYFMKFTVILSMTPVVDFEAGAVIRDLKQTFSWVSVWWTFQVQISRNRVLVCLVFYEAVTKYVSLNQNLQESD